MESRRAHTQVGLDLSDAPTDLDRRLRLVSQGHVRKALLQ